MSQARGTANNSAASRESDYWVNASIEYDPSKFHDLPNGTFIQAKVTTAGGTPFESWFQLTGGSKIFPTQMRIDYRPTHQAISIFNATVSQGLPALFPNVPVQGRDKIIGKFGTFGPQGEGPSMAQSVGGSVGGGSSSRPSDGGSVQRGSNASTIRGGRAGPA